MNVGYNSSVNYAQNYIAKLTKTALESNQSHAKNLIINFVLANDGCLFRISDHILGDELFIIFLINFYKLLLSSRLEITLRHKAFRQMITNSKMKSS